MLSIKDVYAGIAGRTPNGQTRWIAQHYPDMSKMTRDLIAMMYSKDVKYGIKVPNQEFDSDELLEEDWDEVLLYQTLLNVRCTKVSKEKHLLLLDYIANKGGKHILLFILKSFKTGLGYKGVAAAGLVDSWSPQKGVSTTLETVGDTANHIAELKLNGYRLVTLITVGGAILFRTYNGKYLDIPELKDRVRALLDAGVFLRGWAYDGELVHGQGRTEADRISVTDAVRYNTAMSFEGLNLVIFDAVETEVILAGKPTYEVLSVRRKRISRLPPFGADARIRQNIVYDLNVVSLESILADLLKGGYEGLMVKALDSIYECRKNSNWRKLKGYKEMTVVIKGINPHKKTARLIGSLQCEGVIEYNGVYITIKVSTGSGLNDEDRCIAPSYLIGGIVEILYTGVTQDSKTGVYSVTNSRFHKPDRSVSILQVLRQDTGIKNQ